MARGSCGCAGIAATRLRDAHSVEGTGGGADWAEALVAGHAWTSCHAWRSAIARARRRRSRLRAVGGAVVLAVLTCDHLGTRTGWRLDGGPGAARRAGESKHRFALPAAAVGGVHLCGISRRAVRASLRLSRVCSDLLVGAAGACCSGIGLSPASPAVLFRAARVDLVLVTGLRVGGAALVAAARRSSPGRESLAMYVAHLLIISHLVMFGPPQMHLLRVSVLFFAILAATFAASWAWRRFSAARADRARRAGRRRGS